MSDDTPRAGPLRTADSLASARAGELVFVDRRGNVIGRSERRRLKAVWWAWMGTAVALNGVLYTAMFSPLAGGLAVAVTSAFVVARLRKWPACRAAMALIAGSRWEEAHATLMALQDGGGLPRKSRGSVRLVLAMLDQTLGRHQAALDRVEPVLATLGSSSAAVRWQAVSVRAMALIQLGRLADARRERDRFVLPRTELVDLLYQRIALSLAFEADDVASLPADDVLHDWARAALERSRFGELLVGLAWAFHRRGDDDMARHLLAESTSRMPRSSLPTAQPRLEAWAATQREAWAIETSAVE